MTKSGKGVHRVASGTRGARRMAAATSRVLTPHPSLQPEDVQAHNRAIDERNAAKRLRRSAKK